MNDSPGALELLSERVDNLERRVRALEHPAGSIASEHLEQVRIEPEIETAPELAAGRLFPLIGRAMLGIAGAYVLRAIAEAGVVPKLPISAFAVAYAFGWLVWSTRVSSSVARGVYAATSALILAPMLWENTLVFHAFTPIVTAGVLAAFLTVATVLEARTAELRGMWIAQSVVVLTTAALGFTTLEGLPFITALLVALCVMEFARTRDLAQPAWPLIVLVTDVMVSGLIFIYSGSPETRAAYPALPASALIAPSAILLGVSTASVFVRVVIGKCRVMVFEATQILIAFALAAVALVIFAPARGGVFLGVMCFALSAGAYASAFGILRVREEQRSFRVFALWGAALFLAGSLWAFPQSIGAALLAAAAIVALYAARRTETGMLEFHGAIFMLSAAVMAGMPRFLYGCVAGSPPHSPSPGVLIVSICAFVALALVRPLSENAAQRAVHLVLAFVAVCGVTALLIQTLLAGAGSLTVLELHHLAFLRSLSVCLVVLAIAFGGSRWGRPELTHLAYAALALLALKFPLEDLRRGHMGFVAASIALFAITLMSVPRLVKLSAKGIREAQSKTKSTQEPQVPV